MRDDFQKVVIERARWGSRRRNLKTRWHTNRYNPDEEYPFPKTASSSWNWNPDRKEFSDRLGPLERYLDKQVGRPWRKVEGEFFKALDTSTVVGKHLWDHARKMVETEMRELPDGRVVDLAGYRAYRFYVHPRTGLLRRVKPERTDPSAERRKRIDRAEKVVLDARVTAEKVKDLWYLLIDTGRTEDADELRWDKQGRPTVIRVRRPVIRKKQANTDELRRIRAALERSV